MKKHDFYYQSLTDLNFDHSVRDYEFTRSALVHADKVLSSEAFETMDSGPVLDLILKELRLICFGDYLKRFLYLELGLTQPFHSIDTRFYEDLILTAFRDHHTPFSLEGVSTAPRRVVNRWLTQQSVSRQVVFLLGFGLAMSLEQVNEFLTKVLLEESCDITDPTESVYMYCFSKGLSYAHAVIYLEQFQSLFPTAGTTSVRKNPSTTFLRSEKTLLKHLAYLKSPEAQQSLSGTHTLLLGVYDQVRQKIADNRRDASVKLNEQIDPEKITPADLEKELYAGVPRTDKGNLQKSSLSLLASYFGYHFLTRQRLEKLLKGKYRTRRFDLITLCFYLYADNASEPKERLSAFLAHTNKLLKQAKMYPLYAANPYDAFIMLCLLSELPMITFSDILELSFPESRK